MPICAAMQELPRQSTFQEDRLGKEDKRYDEEQVKRMVRLSKVRINT